MNWMQHYQVFLFDFDGILVNTEELHYKAYLKMCKERGFSLTWDMRTYMQHAMFTATGVEKGIYKAFPALYEQEPSWNVLYQEKKRAYMHFLLEEGVALMPGAAHLLEALEARGIKRCVVTHSAAEQIAAIRKQHPILDSIPHWITREQYAQPKPSSDCYKHALTLLKGAGERAIGFEDSPRGLKALLGTEAEGVWLSPFFGLEESAQISKETGRSFVQFDSFPALFKNWEG